jgi:hypothetical protein
MERSRRKEIERHLSEEIQHLLREEFGVEYSLTYLDRSLLRDVETATPPIAGGILNLLCHLLTR